MPTFFNFYSSTSILSKRIKYIRRWLDISKEMNVNETIRAREVRLIDANGDQLGVKSRAEALEIAQKRNLDLLQLPPARNPPHSSPLAHQQDSNHHDETQTAHTTQT